jgi:hypothetical protein
MALRIAATVGVIVLLVLVLAYFLNLIAALLRSIEENLKKISIGVRLIESQCEIIGPGADQVNATLAQTAAGLGIAIQEAERLGAAKAQG